MVDRWTQGYSRDELTRRPSDGFPFACSFATSTAVEELTDCGQRRKSRRLQYRTDGDQSYLIQRFWSSMDLSEKSSVAASENKGSAFLCSSRRGCFWPKRLGLMTCEPALHLVIDQKKWQYPPMTPESHQY